MIVLPVLAGLAGLALMGNPPKRKRRRKNPLGGKSLAAARARQVRRCTTAARWNKRTKGSYAAFCQSLKAQCRARSYGVKSRRASAAVQRGILQARKNPQLSAALRKRLMEWRSPLFPAIKALAVSKHPATEAHDALRHLNQQYERPDLRKGDLAHLAKTIALVEAETGVRANPGVISGIKGPKSLASKILQWHGGQSSPCYLVGSRWHSGLSCLAVDVRDCVWELEKTLTQARAGGYSQRDLRSLESLIRAVKRKIH